MSLHALKLKDFRKHSCIKIFNNYKFEDSNLRIQKEDDRKACYMEVELSAEVLFPSDLVWIIQLGR